MNEKGTVLVEKGGGRRFFKNLKNMYPQNVHKKIEKVYDIQFGKSMGGRAGGRAVFLAAARNFHKNKTHTEKKNYYFVLAGLTLILLRNPNSLGVMGSRPV